MTEEEYQHVIDLAIQQQEELDRLEQEQRMEEDQTIPATSETLPGAIPVSSDPPLTFNGNDFIDTNFVDSSTSGTYTVTNVESEALMPEVEAIPTFPKKKLKKRLDELKNAPNDHKLFRKKILAIAQATMGKENACIQTNKTQGSSGYSKEMLMLKWDYINMFNRSGDKHDISDMYVTLPLDDRTFTDSIHGFRGKLTSAEYHSGYSHSHLWTYNWHINPFCTGADGINDLWADLKMTSYTNEEFDIKLEGFIHQLEAFLSYESIEGTPYIRFNNIGSVRVRHLSSTIIGRDVKAIIRALNDTDIDLAMDFNDGEVILIETEHLHNVMAMMASEHQKRLPNGTYVNLGLEDDPNSNGFNVEHSEFKFLGKEHQVFVEPFNNTNDKSDVKKERKYAHGSVVAEIKRRFETIGGEKLQAYCLENSISIKDEEEGSDNNWRKFNPRNLVPVDTTLNERVVGSPVLETEQGSKSGKAGDDKHKGRSSISE